MKGLERGFSDNCIVLVLLRDKGNFGVCGPMFYYEAMAMEEVLKEYDYWKIVSLLELINSHSSKLVIDDKYDISFME